MAVKREDIKQVMDNQKLQLLYSLVKSSIVEEKAEDKKEADEQLKGTVDYFKDNVISLIKLILDNKISPNHVAGFMILLINKILISENEDTLSKAEIPNLNKSTIMPAMLALHKLCKKEAFKAAICKIQANFITDCIVSVESPLYNLRQQLQSSKLRLSNFADEDSQKTAESSIRRIEAEIDSVVDKTKKIEEFCTKHKVEVELPRRTEFKVR